MRDSFDNDLSLNENINNNKNYNINNDNNININNNIITDNLEQVKQDFFNCIKNNKIDEIKEFFFKPRL